MDIAFNQDGTYREETVARIRIQSDAAVQQFGVIPFPYESGSSRVESIEVRVRKPDATIVVTPDSNIQDLAAGCSPYGTYVQRRPRKTGTSQGSGRGRRP